MWERRTFALRGSSSIHIFFKRFFREVIKSSFTIFFHQYAFILSHFFKNVKVKFLPTCMKKGSWTAFHKRKNILFLIDCTKQLLVRLPFPIDTGTRNYINVCFRPQTTLCHFLLVQCFQTLKMILERLTMWDRTTLVDQISFKSAEKNNGAKQLHDVPVRCESFAIALESFVHL